MSRLPQIVAAQLALVLAIAGLAAGLAWAIPALLLAFFILVLATGRLRRRWIYEWLAHGTRYLTRTRTLPAGAGAAELLDFVRPAATVSTLEVDGASVGVVVDPLGLTALVEVGDPSALIGDPNLTVPELTALLPVHGGHQPSMRVQLLIAGVAAPSAQAGSGASGTSYRQLTDGRVLAQQRVIIAVHARRVGGFGDDELRTALTGSLRRVRRRLDRDHLPSLTLAAESVLRVIAETARHDLAQPVRETWTGLEIGGLRQVTFRLSNWPRRDAELAKTLVPRLIVLPSAETVVSLIVEGDMRAELTVRLAAADPAGMANAVAALRRLLGTTDGTLERLDGAQLAGLGATLPLGGVASAPDAALSGLVTGRDALAVNGARPAPIDRDTLTAIRPAVGGAGLVLGLSRDGAPVVVRLFRPEPTRAALIGGLPCAETLVLRAVATGAEVIVLSGRPYRWEPFRRGLSGTEQFALVTPGRIVDPPAPTPGRPQLLVVDVGPLGATGLPVVEAPWRATLLVRDELTAGDLDVLARADLALLQPLAEHEASLAADAFGLGDSAGWLTRIKGDMLGVVVSRKTVRWAQLASTPIERQLIGAATRP
jgi:type VII secretion protein EccE